MMGATGLHASDDPMHTVSCNGKHYIVPKDIADRVQSLEDENKRLRKLSEFVEMHNAHLVQKEKEG